MKKTKNREIEILRDYNSESCSQIERNNQDYLISKITQIMVQYEKSTKINFFLF